MGKTILLTGRPGVGKTTVIERVLEALPETTAGGFFTREFRDAGGARLGFEIVTLDGQCAVLAHAGSDSRYRVGRYGVDVAALEQVGVAAIHGAIQEADLVVVDEIGKMELFSPAFREAVLAALRSPKPVLATIMVRPHPFPDEVKRLPGVTLLEVTERTRDRLPEHICALLVGNRE